MGLALFDTCSNELERGVNNILMKFTGDAKLTRDKKNREARGIKVISNTGQK